MSDVMLFGIAEMPFDMAMGDEISRRQFYANTQRLVAEVRDTRAQLAAALAGQGRDAKDAELARAIERAAKELPERWFIRVEVEAGSAWVEMFDAEAVPVDFEDAGDSLADSVGTAIDFATTAENDAGGAQGEP